MSTITPKSLTIAGSAADFAATAVAGDEISYSGGDLLIEFRNGHTGSITVNVAPTKTTGVVTGAGPVTIPTRSLALPAGSDGAFLLKSDQIGAYVNANNRIPITYTGGNVAMLVRAIRL
ncbi:hypothetical protein GR212_15400 [Rhizobium lusitanum]|uniref:Uncharacterized protein n=1 Tax=Rhizobium lusitanum TaxID=293958 RepID=A0A6L9U6D3_9HYPH|nr:hypothetical protein [Rhizobium lusitanum]NEI70969.1 hypothetical protein [Rhizobium lusitanum]